jgi:hypothetical protein
VKIRLLSVAALAMFIIVTLSAAVGKSQTLSNQGPFALFVYLPDAPIPGETVVFDASSSYAPNGQIATYAWDFGDGITATVGTPTISHVFLVDGAYTVELTVTDTNGASDSATAVLQVSTVVFFRVVISGTTIPLANAKVSAYYKDGGTWKAITPGPSNMMIKYDNTTQPHLASTSQEKYRNPGFTASILRADASNIGCDIYPGCWSVYFKIEWGPFVTYWPNETTRVFSYKNGAVEQHSYASGHRATWDSSASTYVIHVNDIPGNGVSPTESHPIIVGILCPPPPVQYYLTVNTNPTGMTTIPGQGWYGTGTSVPLSAPDYMNVTSNSRYRFRYWDLDGVSQGVGVNPIQVTMLVNHTATAHYVKQYAIYFTQNGLAADATGTIVTVNGTGKSLSDLPFTYWVDSGSSVAYAYSSTVASSITGKQYTLNGITGPSSPVTVTSSSTVCGNYLTQCLITFAQTGLDGTATGTVVNVNGTAKTYSQLPFAWWVNSGSTITYQYNSIVTSSVADKQFRLTGIHSPTSPFTVTGTVTITGSYCIQYKVVFAQTGLDATVTGTVLTVNGNPKAYTNLPYSDWYDAGTTITYSYNDPVLSTATGKKFKRTSVTGTGSPFNVTGPTPVTGNYKAQFQITFDKTGVGTDFTGTVVTIDSINYNAASLPIAFWWDQSSSHTFSFSSPLIVNASVQYAWTSTSGLSTLQSGTLSITASGNVVGNYLTANCVTFDKTGVGTDYLGTVVDIDGTPYGASALPVSFAWQTGSVHSFAFHSPLVVNSNVKQYIWTSTTGLSTLKSGSLTVTTYGSVVGNYKTQYYLTLAVSPPSVATPTGTGWYDSGTYASISTPATVDIVADLSRYKFCNWTTNDMAEITNATAPTTTVLMDKGKTVTVNYVTQYKITFNQSGVSGYLGGVVNIDGTDYATGGLPSFFWWNSGSSHSFAFYSPLIFNSSLQYSWTSTSGLTSLQSGTHTVSGSGSITGNYAALPSYQVTFDQTGASADFGYNVVTIDGAGHNVTQLPVSFWWTSGSGHTFSYASPLNVDAQKRYFWTSTSGLSSAQSGSITVSSSGSVIGIYKTQYYVTLETNPTGVSSPSGTGWYDVGTNATIDTPAFVDIVPGSSRYRFNGWTTGNMSEIADPSRSPTTVIVDEGKTVTATYVVQYAVAFNQSGVGSDFANTIVTIDTIDYNYSGLPAQFMWDNGTMHSFEFKSPLVVTVNSKRYIWTGTTGLSTGQSDTITVTTFGNIDGSYRVQYYLKVATNPPGIATIPGEGWYNGSASVMLTAPTVPNYTFDHWYVNGASQGAGVNPITITMNGAYNAQAYYNPIAPYVLTITTTSGGTTNPAPGAYSYSSGQTVQVTAIPNSGYVLDHWELDGTNVSSSNNPIAVTMNGNHNLKAVFKTTPAPPTVAINPQSSTINPGQSVQFASMVNGGSAPYQYQWYLDGTPVPSATSNTWKFTATTNGIHYVQLKVNDALNNTVFSNNAQITVTNPVPIGGYAISYSKQRQTLGIAIYTLLIAAFGAILTAIKRKKK